MDTLPKIPVAPVTVQAEKIDPALCKHEWRNLRISMLPVVWVRRCKLCGAETKL